MSLTRLFIGRPLGNREAEGKKLGVLTGVPVMGLDGPGSAAYGPEAGLTILAATGSAGFGAIGPVTWVILVLLAILFASYWQSSPPTRTTAARTSSRKRILAPPRACSPRRR